MFHLPEHRLFIWNATINPTEPKINGEWQTTRTLFGRHVPGAETPARDAARAGLERAWQRRHEVVRAFVKQLRGKLGDAAAERAWIFNVRGVGYDREAWMLFGVQF